MSIRPSAGTLSKIRRRLRKVLVAASSLVVLYVLIGCVFHVLIWAEIRRIRSEGYPVSPAQLSVKVPSAQNGAVIYDKAFRLIEYNFPTLSSLSNKWERDKSPRFWERAEVLAEMEKFSPIVRIVRKAALKPKCNFDAYREGPYDVYKAKVRSLALLLGARALVLAHRGDVQDAMSALSLRLHVADSLKDEPSCMSVILRRFIYQTTSDDLYEIYTQRPVTDEQAVALIEQLDWEDLQRHASSALIGRRVLVTDFFNGISKNNVPPEDFCEFNYANYLLRLECSPIGDPILRADQYRAMRVMHNQINIAKTPFRKMTPPEHRGFTCGCWSPSNNWSFADSELLVVEAYGWRKSLDTTKAHVSGTRVAVAICFYKKRFGAFPRNLNQLAKLGWKLDLEDPFSGRAYVYRQQGKGFILYSIGPDLKDDAGREKLQYTEIGEERFDIAWTNNG